MKDEMQTQSAAQIETDRVLAQLDAVVEEMRAGSRASIACSEKFARTARAARPSRSSQSLRAVRPGELPSEETADASDLTRRFMALKQAL